MERYLREEIPKLGFGLMRLHGGGRSGHRGDEADGGCFYGKRLLLF